ADLHKSLWRLRLLATSAEADRCLLPEPLHFDLYVSPFQVFSLLAFDDSS
ncbi:MAG: hypothetical protein ACI9HK_002815, partial [Pirellulaceae bacterium]